MESTNDVVSVTVVVEYLHNKERVNDIVPFRIMQTAGVHKAVPYISEADRVKMQLPQQLSFSLAGNQISTPHKDHQDLIARLANELRVAQWTNR